LYFGRLFPGIGLPAEPDGYFAGCEWFGEANRTRRLAGNTELNFKAVSAMALKRTIKDGAGSVNILLLCGSLRWKRFHR